MFIRSISVAIRVVTYSPSHTIQEMNLHAFRAANDIYQSMRSKKLFSATADDDNCTNEANCAEESRWIQTTVQSEGDGNLVDWGLREVGDVLYLSFRGTAGGEITDVLTDIAVVYGSMNFEKGETFKIHLGFKNFVDEEFEKFLKEIENTIQLYTKESKKKFQYLCVTGHSLGGGVAQVFTLRYLSLKKPPIAAVYTPTFAAPPVHFIPSKDGFKDETTHYAKWRKTCVNFVYQWDVVAFSSRAAVGILEKMDADFDKTLVGFGKKLYALFQAYLCDDKENFHAEFLTLAKGLISQAVVFANLDYLKKFEAVSGTTVLLYHPDENTGAEFNESSGHKFKFHKLNHDHIQNFNSLALESDLHQFFAKYMESITLKYHKLKSYERAMEKLCSNVTQTCPTGSFSATNNTASSSP